MCEVENIAEKSMSSPENKILSGDEEEYKITQIIKSGDTVSWVMRKPNLSFFLNGNRILIGLF